MQPVVSSQHPSPPLVSHAQATDTAIAMRAALRDAATVQSAYHSGVRNMYLLSSVGFAVIAFAVISKAQGWLRLALCGLGAAVILYSVGYGECVAKWHHDATSILSAGINGDSTVPPGVGRTLVHISTRSWEDRVRAFTVVEVCTVLVMLLVIFIRPSSQ